MEKLKKKCGGESGSKRAQYNKGRSIHETKNNSSAEYNSLWIRMDRRWCTDRLSLLIWLALLILSPFQALLTRSQYIISLKWASYPCSNPTSYTSFHSWSCPLCMFHRCSQRPQLRNRNQGVWCLWTRLRSSCSNSAFDLVRRPTSPSTRTG